MLRILLTFSVSAEACAKRTSFARSRMAASGRKQAKRTYQSNEAEAQAAVRDIEALGRRALALRLDVGDSASFAAFAQHVRSALNAKWQRGRFDYLVNNAGTGRHVAFAGTTEAQFDELIRVAPCGKKKPS